MSLPALAYPAIIDNSMLVVEVFEVSGCLVLGQVEGTPQVPSVSQRTRKLVVCVLSESSCIS